jgi:hypothetical protein
MFIKTLVAGFGVCSIFLAGLWVPGVAQASLTTPFMRTSNSYEKSESVKPGVSLNGNVPVLLMASRRGSTYREENTRRSNRGYRPRSVNNRVHRENNRRKKSHRFSRQSNRDYSIRDRLSHRRSSRGRGRNSFRDNPYIFKRPKSRRFEFITPR